MKSIVRKCVVSFDMAGIYELFPLSISPFPQSYVSTKQPTETMSRCCKRVRPNLAVCIWDAVAAYALFALILKTHALPIRSWSKARCLPRGEGRSVAVPPGATEDEMREIFMDLALIEARKAGAMGEVPIGAIVVQEVTENPSLSPGGGSRLFDILSVGMNQVETKADASAHAELEAMRSAASSSGNWRLLNTTLYSTLEPCPMCLAAAQAFRVKEVAYGAPDIRLGAVETHIRLLDMAVHPYHPSMEVVGGVRAAECAKIIKDFFKKRRMAKKESLALDVLDGVTRKERWVNPMKRQINLRAKRVLQRFSIWRQ